MTAEFIRGIVNFTPRNGDGSVVTVGTFDGIHIGHQAIFKRVRDEAKRLGRNAVLVTFQPHPRVVVTPADIPMLLTSIEEKKQFVPDFFDGQVLILKFDEELRNMSAEQFVKDLLVDTVHVKKLIVGYDHAFGKGRSGDSRELCQLAEKYGFEVEVVDPVECDGEPVSSSRIRRLIIDGKLEEALHLLGHEYAIYGTVERGIGLGRKLGYPTANVAYSSRKLLPPEGVYACWNVVHGKSYPGMMFIGQNHFNPEQKVSVETNLFDFDEDIYDEEIIVYPTHFVRESVKFDSTDELKEQLAKDKNVVMEIMNKGETTCR